MFLCLDMVLNIEGYLYILCVTLFRLIVSYPQYKVNRDTNLSVVYVLCNIFIASTMHLCSLCGVPNLCGASPLCCSLLHTIWFRSSGCASSKCGSDGLRRSPRGRYNETGGPGCCEEEAQATSRPTKMTIIEARC